MTTVRVRPRPAAPPTIEHDPAQEPEGVEVGPAEEEDTEATEGDGITRNTIWVNYYAGAKLYDETLKVPFETIDTTGAWVAVKQHLASRHPGKTIVLNDWKPFID